MTPAKVAAETQILELGNRVLEELRSMEAINAASLRDALLRVPWPRALPFWHDIVDFLITCILDEPIPQRDHEALANKLAFMWLSTDRGSETYWVLERASQVAFHRMGGVLSPYVDAGDLHEMLRWKLWRARGELFKRTRLLAGEGGLSAYATMAARRLALDEIRKFQRRNRMHTEYEEDVLPKKALPDNRLELYQEVESALTAALGEDDLWLAPYAVTAMVHTEDRKALLSEVNRERAKKGLAEWTMNAFNGFIFRLRQKMRAKVPVD